MDKKKCYICLQEEASKKLSNTTRQKPLRNYEKAIPIKDLFFTHILFICFAVFLFPVFWFYAINPTSKARRYLVRRGCNCS